MRPTLKHFLTVIAVFLFSFQLIASEPLTSFAVGQYETIRKQYFYEIFGDSSGHTHIKTIIRERYGRHISEGQTEAIWEMDLYQERCQILEGAEYLIDRHYRSIRVEKKPVVLCPIKERYYSRTYVRDYYSHYVLDENGEVFMVDVRYVVWSYWSIRSKY